jgi:hypothetical protein
MRQLFNHEVDAVSGGSYFKPTLAETVIHTANEAAAFAIGYAGGAAIGYATNAILGYESPAVTQVLKAAAVGTAIYSAGVFGINVYNDPGLLGR